MKNLTLVDWYKALIEECQAIVSEGEFIARLELARAYHAMGLRVLEDVEKSGDEKMLVQRVAEGLQRSSRTIQYAVDAAKFWPAFDEIPIEGKNITWRAVCRAVDSKGLPRPERTKSPPKGSLDVEKLKRRLDEEIKKVDMVRTNFIGKDDVLSMLRLIRHDFCGSMGFGVS